MTYDDPFWARALSLLLLIPLGLLILFSCYGLGLDNELSAWRSQQDEGAPYAIFSIPNDERTWEALRDLDVRWVRLQGQLGEGSPSDDPRIGRTLVEGYGLWLTLYHRERENIANSARFDQSERGSFPPADPARYRQLINQALSPLLTQLRSRGMAPGERLVIQFVNEVIPEDVAPPNATRFWHGTSQEYLDSLALTYSAVKALDSSIPVAMGGISSATLEAILEDENSNGPSPELQKIVEFNKRLLTEGQFDWADLHLYHAIDSIPDKVRWVREHWQGPLAATEVGGPDERTGIPVTDATHAQDLSRRVPLILASGVDRVFWSFLQDRDIEGDRLAQTLGLIDLNWVRKPAFGIYADIIAGGD